MSAKQELLLTRLSQNAPKCRLCGITENLLVCSRCKNAWYCSKEHQTKDWKAHKKQCNEKDHRQVQSSKSFMESVKEKPNVNQQEFAYLSDIVHEDPVTVADDSKSLSDYVVQCLNDYGICVVDNFLGEETGSKVLEEVKTIHSSGKLCDGELVNKCEVVKNIRGDLITWTEQGDDGAQTISMLMQKLDRLIMSCNKRFGSCEVGGRTKAMVACYPGNGSHYMKHVDNPNEDGRCITVIYYLNKNWDITRDGGLLRIFPAHLKQVADVEPIFDRLLFFWSDRRNPHEVQAAYNTRYAITVWYFDRKERARAKIKHKIEECATASK